MTYDDFNKLTDEEKEAAFNSISEEAAKVADKDAEISSYNKELEELKNTNSKLNEDLKSAKELNFTLARKVDNKPTLKFEDALHQAFGISK